jgi:hypothetical protein
VTPERITALQAWFDQACAFCEETQKGLKSLSEAISTAFGPKHDLYDRNLSNDLPKELRESAAEDVVKFVIRQAEREYSSANSLTIDENEVLRALAGGYDPFGRDHDYGNSQYRPPMPLHVVQTVGVAGVAEYLEKNYGGKNGIEAERQQAADDLYSAFSMAYHKPTWSKGRLLINLHAYTEVKEYGENKGERVLQYGSREGITKALSAMGVFLECYGEENTDSGAHLIRPIISYWAQYDPVVKSRQKWEVLEGLYFTTFSDKFVWSFDEAIAREFMAFVSTYCSRMKAAA